MPKTASYHVMSFIKDNHSPLQLDIVRPAALWKQHLFGCEMRSNHQSPKQTLLYFLFLLSVLIER